MDSDFQLCSRAGIRWLRISLPTVINRFYSSNPNNGFFPTVYNLKTAVTEMRKYGIKPLVDLAQWHYPYTDQSKRREYKAWLEQAVKIMGDDVSAYEIGDEVNLPVENCPGCNADFEEPGGWNYRMTPERLKEFNSNTPPVGDCNCHNHAQPGYEIGVESYVEWLRDSYQTIKKANPNATVVAGALSDWQAMCFLRMFTVLRGYRYADAISWHPYPFYSALNPPPTAADSASSTAELQEIIANWPSPYNNLPIWITEYGFSTSTSDGAMYVGNSSLTGEQVKSQDIASEWHLLREQYRINTPIFLYAARDLPTSEAWWRQNGRGGFGIFERGNPWLTNNASNGKDLQDGGGNSSSFVANSHLLQR
jgi:hypothetical protein